MLYTAKKLNCNGRIVDLSQAQIMGILNLTPDSFYDGGRYQGEAALRQVENMLVEGADIIDIGGESTRPGSKIISSKNEWERFKGVIKKFKFFFPKTLLSVDTRKSLVMENSIHYLNIFNEIIYIR